MAVVVVAVDVNGGGGKSIKEECRQLFTISSPNIEPNCSTFCNSGGDVGGIIRDDGVDAGRMLLILSL